MKKNKLNLILAFFRQRLFVKNYYWFQHFLPSEFLKSSKGESYRSEKVGFSRALQIIGAKWVQHVALENAPSLHKLKTNDAWGSPSRRDALRIQGAFPGAVCDINMAYSYVMIDV